MLSAVFKYCLITLLILPLVLTASDTGHYFSKLKTAVSNNELETVHQLLLQNTTDWLTAAGGWEIARIAAENGNLRVIEYIGERKLSILGKKNKKGETIGHIAAEHGHPNITEYFLKKWRYDSTLKLSDSETALLFDLVAKKGYLNCISDIIRSRNDADLERIGRIAADNGHLGIACHMASTGYSFHGEKFHSIIKTALEKSRKVDPETLELFVQLADHWHWNFCPDVIGLAASANRIDLIQYLAEKRCDCFLHEYRSSEDLRIAFQKNLVNHRFLECLEKANGTILGYIGHSEETICHLAAEYGRLDVITFMTEKNSSILEKTDSSGDTVVGIAADKGHADIVRYVVRRNPSSAARYDYSYSEGTRVWEMNVLAFHLAIVKNLLDMDTLKYVVEKDGTLVTRINPQDGKTAAHMAAEIGNMKILRYLVKKQPSVLSASDHHNDTILHILAKHNALNKERLAFFVDQGAPVDAENCADRTVGHILAVNGHADSLEYLVEKEPSILTIKDRNGDTVLHLLTRKNALSVKNLEFFVDKGGSLISENNEKENIALLAAMNGNVSILQYVVKKVPAVLTGKASVGDQIVEVAAHRGHSNVLKLIAKEAPAVLAGKPNLLFKLSNSSEVLGVLRRLKAACEARITNWDRRHFENELLREALEYDYPNIFEFMEYDVNMMFDEGAPLIFATVRRNRSNIFHYLAENRRTNLTALDREGNNILFIAAMRHDLKKMRYILDTLKVPIDVEWRNYEGNTLLHVSVLEALSRADKARDVQQQAADREARKKQAAREASRNYGDYYNNEESDSEDAEEELVTHPCQGDNQSAIDVIKYLVEEKHARVNARGLSNETALHWATSRANFNISNYLLNHGADPKLRDADEHNFWQVLHFTTLKAKTGR